MPLTEETKRMLAQKGIAGISDPPGQPVRIYIESEKDLLLLPSEVSIAGISRPVKGIVSGRFYALQDRTVKWRPAPSGISVGHKNITAGTLGCIVRDRTTGRRVILSNNHVLAYSNQASIGDEILQPGKYDGGTLEDTIARLTRFVEIKEPPSTNLVDTAIATPLSDDLVIDEILDIGKLVGVVEAREGMGVKKSGRTTGLTSGKVFDTLATVKVYGYPFPEEYAIFEDQLIADPIMKGGDSGSVWVSGDNRIMGLGFAGSDTFSVANKIQHVFDLLNLESPREIAVAAIPILALPLAVGMAVGMLFLAKSS
jgi:hypothetical protein